MVKEARNIWDRGIHSMDNFTARSCSGYMRGILESRVKNKRTLKKSVRHANIASIIEITTRSSATLRLDNFICDRVDRGCWNIGRIATVGAKLVHEV
jgi:hypothetical protein